MKKTIFALIIFVILILACSCASTATQDFPEWAGIFTGVIPAADCPGISVVAILKTNGTYKITYQYIDRGDELFTYTGIFTWDEKAKAITLDSSNIPSYKVKGNFLIHLDMEGKEIEGKLADKYKLKRL